MNEDIRDIRSCIYYETMPCSTNSGIAQNLGRDHELIMTCISFRKHLVIFLGGVLIKVVVALNNSLEAGEGSKGNGHIGARVGAVGVSRIRSTRNCVDGSRVSVRSILGENQLR